MLATNPEIYTKVLKLEGAKDSATGAINWDKFFNSTSIYKLLYTLQIVEAVMEEGEGEGLEKIEILDETETKKKASAAIPQAPPLSGAAVVPPITIINADLPDSPPALVAQTSTTSIDEKKVSKVIDED